MAPKSLKRVNFRRFSLFLMVEADGLNMCFLTPHFDAKIMGKKLAKVEKFI